MRQRIDLDREWKFFEGALSPDNSCEGWGGAKARAYSFGAISESLDDAKWRTLDLPHDYVMEGDHTQKKTLGTDMLQIPEMESIDSRHFAGGSLEGGIGWYRKRFTIPEEYAEKRVCLHFDGVYRDSMVYLNEYYVDRYEDGYTHFYYDITDFLNMGGENLLAVRVDSTGREGWWYEGGGIYRHVWLEIREKVSIPHNGVFVSSQVNLEQKSAILSFTSEIENRLLENVQATIVQTVCDPDGNEAAQTRSALTVAAWDQAICPQECQLQNVELWDIEHPHLYTLRTDLYLGETLTDTCTTSFGVRDIRFDADTGLYLNGRNIKVKGLCCHQDHAGVGIAVPDSIWEYRIAQLKSMGANAYRSSHHMPPEELLCACDRMGMLVFSETRRMSSAPQDLQCLRETVRSGRNHPSVFLWGIGNEEIFSQHRPETARTTQTLKAEVRKLDPSRPVTSAVVCWDGKERFDNAATYVNVTQNLDVMGFNYCKSAWDDYHRRMPEQPVIITEASSNSGTRGCYSTNEALGQYYILDPLNESKCKNSQKALRRDMGESEWKYFAERGYLAGIFLWTGMDYRGEPTPLSYPAVSSQFGIFDLCGFPKDNFYYYKSWWTDEPVLHLFPHWNHRAGEKVTVHCYSNLDQVELFVNDTSYGKKDMKPHWYLTWENVSYEPGILMAKGYREGVEVLCEKIQTTGAPCGIVLTPYKDELSVGDAAIIQVRVVDGEGLTVPTADNQISFTVTGAGTFLGVGNGNPGSHENDKQPTRRAFNGLCQLLVRASQKGAVTVMAASDGIGSASCTVTVL